MCVVPLLLLLPVTCRDYSDGLDRRENGPSAVGTLLLPHVYVIVSSPIHPEKTLHPALVGTALYITI